MIGFAEAAGGVTASVVAGATVAKEISECIKLTKEIVNNSKDFPIFGKDIKSDSVSSFDEADKNLYSTENFNEETKKIKNEGDSIKEENEKLGGSYGEVFKEGQGDMYEVHHMPADNVNGLERKDGPAIKMDKEDHRETASCGNSMEAREYRAQQKELIDQGKFREAVQMDIDDIRDKFGSKYDEAISEMLKYVDKLELEESI